MKKSESTPESTLSLRALARALGRDPSHVLRESKRPGFPFVLMKGKGGKSVRRYVLDDVLSYRHHNIYSRKSELATAPTSAATVSEPEIDILPWLAKLIPVTHVINEHEVFCIKKFIGDVLYSEQTMADFESLADHFRWTVGDAMNDVAMIDGKELLTRGTDSYFCDLFAKVDADALTIAFNMGRWSWIERRFVSRPGFEKLLPVPLPLPADKDAKPLRHRLIDTKVGPYQ